MHLEKASDRIPPGLPELLRELGAGEGGFGGTSFGRGAATLAEFLRECRDSEDEAKVGPGLVPQTVFWMIDDRGRAVGMVRMRHRLSDRLRVAGGHVGYYVRPSERRRGYAAAALRDAVGRLREMGETRVLVTVDPTNEASRRVILANGGVFDARNVEAESGRVFDRYWIDGSGLPCY